MKGERRHELQHNALADYITGMVSSVKPYSNAILGSVLLVLVAAVTYFWWSGKSDKQEQAGWNEFLVQKSKDNFQLFDLDEFGDRHKDTQVNFRVQAFSGDMQLIEGCQMLFVNKTAARAKLGKAEEHYNTVRDKCDDPALLLRATFGLARIHEARGRLEEAVKHYEEVVKNGPGTACANQAEARRKFLVRADSEWFYDQFAEYDPAPRTDPIDPGIMRFDEGSLGEPASGVGGSSLLDMPLLGGGASQGDGALLPSILGGVGTPEPDGTPDDGTEAAPKPPPTEPSPTEPSPTEPSPTEPSPTEPAIPDAIEPADSGADAAPPTSP